MGRRRKGRRAAGSYVEVQLIKGALTSDNNSCRRSLHANAGYRLWILLSHASIWEAGVLGVPDRERARSRGPRSRQSTRSAPRQARRGPIRPNNAMIGGFHSSSSVSSHTPATSSNSPMAIASKAAQRGNRSPSAQARTYRHGRRSSPPGAQAVTSASAPSATTRSACSLHTWPLRCTSRRTTVSPASKLRTAPPPERTAHPIALRRFRASRRSTVQGCRRAFDHGGRGPASCVTVRTRGTKPWR